MKITTNNDILFFAFRYALGRMTGAVPLVANEVIRLWDKLPENDKAMYKREIKKAIELEEAGRGIDIKEWERILDL